MTRQWVNWARTEQAQPAARVSPRTPEQVVQAVLRARETGHTVKPMGASHSFTAIAATSGVQLDMSRLRGLVGANTGLKQATFWGGTHLWEIPALLAPLGLAMPNLGDIDSQTITGATQTGTHGTGLEFAGLAAGVTGALICTGEGELLEINAQNRPELLPAVALGLGALGVVVTLTLQCVPRFLLHAREEPAGFRETLEAFEERARASDHFEFFWFPHTQTVRTKTNTRLPMSADRQPLGAVARFVDEELANNLAFGVCTGLGSLAPALVPRINRLIEQVSSTRSYIDESHRVLITQRRVKFRELEYGLPLAAVPSAMRELEQLVERRGYRVSFPIEVRAAAADPLWLSTGYGRETGYIAVHRFWRDRDREYMREAEAILVAHDGRPHWGKLHTQRSATLRGRYPKFAEFIAVRDALDPGRVFSNAYLDRVLGE